MARVKDKYDLGEVCRQIAAARNDPDGQRGVSFDGYSIEMVMSVLETCADFQPLVPEIDRRGLVWEAVCAVAKNAEVRPDDLVREIVAAERGYLRRPLTEVTLASTVTIAAMPGLNRSDVGGLALRFSPRFPKNIQHARNEKRIQSYIQIDSPDLLTTVCVRVSARSDAAAFDAALGAVDYWRAIWNLRLNQTTLMRNTHGARKPVNQILIGPVHTLHKSSGALATETLWYELPHQQSQELLRVGNNLTALRKYERDTKRIVSAMGDSVRMRELITRYGRALDARDYDGSFNRLWSVLENLTCSVGNYSQLIDRTVSMFVLKDQASTRLLLQHLRDVRNGLVHDDRVRSQMESYLFQLKDFVERWFRYHFVRGKKFASMQTASAFLDLPVDSNVLRSRLNLYRKALKFRALPSTT